MTTQRMNEIADLIASELPAEQTGDFAAILKSKIQSTYPLTDLEVIDNQLLAVGIDVNAICRSKHPA